MALSARGPIRDPKNGFVYRLRETARGWEGEQNWIVNTDIEDLSLTAPELPKLGQVWANTPEPAAGCIVLAREPFRMGGVDETGQGGNGGWTRVQVIYGQPSAGGAFSAGIDGKSWTEIRFGSETTTVKYPNWRTKATEIDAPIGVLINPPFSQIAGGDGAPMEVGTIEALVHTYIDPRAVGGLMSRLVRLLRPNRLNRDAITLPRLQMTNAAWLVGQEQARMRGAEVRQPVNGKVEVVISLALAEDWRTVWQPERSDGTGLESTFYRDSIYLAGDFSNLW